MKEYQNSHYLADIHTALVAALTISIFEKKLFPLLNKNTAKIVVSQKSSTNLSMPVPYLDHFFLVDSYDLGTGA
ncbi:hypothetical protein GPY23_11285 [Photorhabdus bodei]|uniref:Uncharacterized protein n=1 Tax=Photorhabdus bodei TaxID=2029681 RepID=A0ABX0AM75_9GAMM|nr:hypothetical protein [Photorhabdus bodei]NDL03867.1 hypothetical protein [Photorhabdus bodei]NDL07918.1 hypothetical protein [Photorhabdus bodei]